MKLHAIVSFFMFVFTSAWASEEKNEIPQIPDKVFKTSAGIFTSKMFFPTDSDNGSGSAVRHDTLTLPNKAVVKLWPICDYAEHCVSNTFISVVEVKRQTFLVLDHSIWKINGSTFTLAVQFDRIAHRCSEGVCTTLPWHGDDQFTGVVYFDQAVGEWMIVDYTVRHPPRHSAMYVRKLSRDRDSNLYLIRHNTWEHDAPLRQTVFNADTGEFWPQQR